MKSKETLRKEGQILCIRECTVPAQISRTNCWPLADCFEKLRQLKTTFAEEGKENWQDALGLKRWHDTFPVGQALVESCGSVWSRLAAEAAHGRSVFEIVKKTNTQEYRLEFEKVNLSIYTALIDQAVALGAYHSNKSPQTIGRWVSNGWLSHLDKQLTV